MKIREMMNECMNDSIELMNKDGWMNEWMGLDIHVDEINECMRKMRKRAPVWTDKCPIKLCSKHILKFKLPGSERQHSCFT